MARITPSISLNENEQKELEIWKKFIGEPDTSKAIKSALFFAVNVALRLFGPKLTHLLQRRTAYDKAEREFYQQK